MAKQIKKDTKKKQEKEVVTKKEEKIVKQVETNVSGPGNWDI